MEWEDSVDQKLERIESAQLETHARLMAIENSNGKIMELFEKLWEGFSQFKDSPMLRMFAGGMSKSSKPKQELNG
jgi:hypothetical protein